MTKLKQNLCVKKYTWKFLWWHGERTKVEHDWKYINREKRICDKCKRKEILYGTFDGGNIEDWRQSV